MTMKKLVGILAAMLIAGGAATQAAEKQEFEAAKAEYQQANSGDEAARLRYVTKLAEIRDRQIRHYWATADTDFDSATAVNEELKKHPAPANSDSKKLSQLLVGKWESPRRTYVYRANGKCGTEDGPISGNWRIQGNRLIQGDLSGPIIFAEPGLLHLLKPRFGVLSFTGERVTGHLHAITARQ